MLCTHHGCRRRRRRRPLHTAQQQPSASPPASPRRRRDRRTSTPGTVHWRPASTWLARAAACSRRVAGARQRAAACGAECQQRQCCSEGLCVCRAKVGLALRSAQRYLRYHNRFWGGGGPTSGEAHLLIHVSVCTRVVFMSAGPGLWGAAGHILVTTSIAADSLCTDCFVHLLLPPSLQGWDFGEELDNIKAYLHRWIGRPSWRK